MLKLYYNGTVITMKDRETAEAVLERDGKILDVGKAEELLAEAKKSKEKLLFRNLEGKTLLPAFIDAHSHFSGMAYSFLEADLSEAGSMDEIAHLLREYAGKKEARRGQWVIAGGYDHNHLKEKRHPDKDVIDQILPDFPVVLKHKSGHMGVFNRKAMEILGVHGEEDNLPGGFLEMKDGEPTGYMEENTFMHFLEKVPMPDQDELLQAYVAAQKKYASYGITLIQEGMMPQQLIPVYRQLLERELLFLDVVAYAGTEDMDAVRKAFPDAVRSYDGKFKIGGYKIFLDGSPQGKTAWMKEPYENDKDGSRGYPTMTDEEICAALEKAYHEGMQILAHCNGDAAAEQYIRAIEKVEKKFTDFRKIRPVMIHAQFLPPELIPEMRGVIPSFFVAHVYHWGDVHIKNMGLARAERMSPAGTAAGQGIIYTFHQDAPVLQPDMLETVRCACERKTASGIVLGEKQRIPVLAALKAVTLNAAYQYGEEETRGSIEPGKWADFVLLDRNPLSVKPEELSEIGVAETIRRGEVIYSA